MKNSAPSPPFLLDGIYTGFSHDLKHDHSWGSFKKLNQVLHTPQSPRMRDQSSGWGGGSQGTCPRVTLMQRFGMLPQVSKLANCALSTLPCCLHRVHGPHTSLQTPGICPPTWRVALVHTVSHTAGGGGLMRLPAGLARAQRHTFPEARLLLGGGGAGGALPTHNWGDTWSLSIAYWGASRVWQAGAHCGSLLALAAGVFPLVPNHPAQS